MIAEVENLLIVGQLLWIEAQGQWDWLLHWGGLNKSNVYVLAKLISHIRPMRPS